jgi:hypothetical protein
MEGGGEAGHGWAMTRQSGGGLSSVQQQTERGGEEKRRVRGEVGCSGARGAFYRAGEGGGSRSEELSVVGECTLKSAVLKMKGTRCCVGSLGKRKVVGQLFGSAPRAWRRARQVAAHGAATPTGWVAAARAEEEDDSRMWAGPGWTGGPNATWAGAERKQRRKWVGLQG